MAHFDAAGFDLAEALEDERQSVGGNAFARIAHLEADHVAFAVRADGDFALRGELDGVAQQVDQHAVEFFAVGAHQR